MTAPELSPAAYDALPEAAKVAYHEARDAAQRIERARIDAIANDLRNAMFDLVLAKATAPLAYPLSASVANDIDTAVSSIVYKLTRQELL